MAEVWRFFAHEDDFADIDEVGACERLGRVLSFPTISSMDAQTVDWQAFADLRAYMQQAGHAHGPHGRGSRGAGHRDRLDARSL